MKEPAPELKRQVIDFGDGNGPVTAHQHPNGGGWVADTAMVHPGAYVGPEARVFGRADVREGAIIAEHGQVGGTSFVTADSRVLGYAKMTGGTLFNATLSGSCSMRRGVVAEGAHVRDNVVLDNPAIEVRDRAVVGGDLVFTEQQGAMLLSGNGPAKIFSRPDQLPAPVSAAEQRELEHQARFGQ